MVGKSCFSLGSRGRFYISFSVLMLCLHWIWRQKGPLRSQVVLSLLDLHLKIPGRRDNGSYVSEWDELCRLLKILWQWLQDWLLMCLFPGWKGDNARLHSSCLLEVCSDSTIKWLRTWALKPEYLVPLFHMWLCNPQKLSASIPDFYLYTNPRVVLKMILCKALITAQCVVTAQNY